MLRRKSLVESTWHAVGTGQGAMLQIRASPAANSFLSLPSKDAHAWPLLLKGTCTLSVTYSGNISGLNDKEWGHIGVNRIPGTCYYKKQINMGFSWQKSVEGKVNYWNWRKKCMVPEYQYSFSSTSKTRANYTRSRTCSHSTSKRKFDIMSQLLSFDKARIAQANEMKIVFLSKSIMNLSHLKRTLIL